ncbi:hypothetical protein [Parendozoicomonas haliclonae]|uniref:hypothetical protein n=1 Tax=Parendozoicomonas haliclonae TaxID=1960125 RepID=UPI0039F132A2
MESFCLIVFIVAVVILPVVIARSKPALFLQVSNPENLCIRGLMCGCQPEERAELQRDILEVIVYCTILVRHRFV